MSERNADLTAAIKSIGGNFDKFTQLSEQRFNDLQGRIEEIEAKRSSPGKTGDDVDSREGREHLRLFKNWVLRPGDGQAQSELREFQAGLARKDVTIASVAGGGYAVPEVIASELEKAERKLSPVRDLVKVLRVGTSDFKHLMSIGGTSSGWVSESGSRSATNTSQLRERAPTHGELYAYPQVSEWAVDDIFFNVGQWLTDEVAEEFSYQEGLAVISGNGTNKPTGMLNTTPVTTSDEASPKRDAAAYQYILGGDNSPASVDGDALIDLQYGLNAKYQANATWVMNSTTAGQVRKLKASGTGEYLWTDNLIVGQPALLLGKPVRIWEQMPDPAGGAFPVAYGDFRRGYLLIDRSEIRITVDQVTNPGFHRFYCRRRVGGCALNNNAVKWLKLL